ncbi:helix-turn-helix domain-containing protein [Enterovirga sp. CN4-39]|uniref:helix-turn-helix domain-containing protein n=1 Tax=Enterovirga sp. CN4-39 TaxID=3400910 RepID=UPI003C0365CA
MDVRPIRTEADLDWALAEVSRYFDQPPEPDTPEADRFDVLTTLIAAYESREHQVPAAGPVEVLRYAIEELGRTQSELAAILGSRSRASEVLHGKRPLTPEMIARISAAWHIPAAALLPVPGLADAA